MNLARTVLAAATTSLLLAGCDYPTDPPILQQRWVIPIEQTTLSVDELLPTSVVAVGSNFDITTDPVNVGETLGNLCASCLDSGGFDVLIPSFVNSFSSTQSLPSDVLSVEVTSGTVQIAITNVLAFDPLEGGGDMTITVMSGAGAQASLGQITITEPLLPGGQVTMISLAVQPGTLTSSLTVLVDVNSPGGQISIIDPSQSISLTATTQSLLISSATVNVPSTLVSIDAEDISTEDLSADVIERIGEGTIRLEITNPFDVAVVGNIDIGATNRAFSISGAGVSTTELQYTGLELQSFLGQPGVFLSGSGVASGTAVTVAPGQEVLIDATLDFTLEIG